MALTLDQFNLQNPPQASVTGWRVGEAPRTPVPVGTQPTVNPTMTATAAPVNSPLAMPTMGATQVQTTGVSQPTPLAGAINGQQFVAQLQGGNPGQGQSASDMINQMWNQAGGGTYTPAQRTALDQMFGNVGQNDVSFDPTVDIVNRTMAGILNPGNAYIDSARRAGLEQAASRGGLNGSIGAGAAQRAAIDASMPIFNQAMNLTGQREQQSWQGRENELARILQQQGMRADVTTQREAQDFQGTQADLDRAGQRANAALDLTGQRENLAFQGQQAGLDRVQNVNNQLLQQQLRERQTQMDFGITQALQSDRVAQQDWLASQDYTRQFNGNLAMMPITNSFQMNQAILDYAMANPEVYSPEVISGLNNFFNGNMVSILQQYFPNMVQQSGGNS